MRHGWTRRSNDGTPVIPEGCWYELIEDALTRSFGYRLLRRTATARSCDFESRSLPERSATKRSRAAGKRKSPHGSRQAAAREVSTHSPRSRRPAQRDDDARMAASPSAFDRESALLRGTLVHRLMQSLPDIAPERRAERGARVISRAPAETSMTRDARRSPRRCSAILDSTVFEPLFAPGSRAEVPIVGQLGTRRSYPARSTGWR